jgi:O-antigen/teichoic acid export membrane protein
VTLGGQSVRILLQVLSVALLARLLDPADYGLVAMVLAITGVGEVFRDFGLSSAAIQARDLTSAQRSNLFWINTGIGVLLTSAAFLAAGPVAAVYGEPDLVPIARALSLTFLINGLATQYRADLNRRLRFARIAAADVAAPAVGLGVALVLALQGASYWALVAQQLTQALVLLLVLVLSARWLPGRPRRGVAMGGLLRFGWNLVAAQLVGYAAKNVDSLLIGVRFGAGPLGYYNRAFQLVMAPLGQLRSPTTTVALPVLARLTDDDDRYGAFVRRGQLALGYTLVAGLAVAVSAAEPLTDVFLGERWSSVAPVLRLLSLAGIFQTLAYVGYWVYLSRGLTGALLRFSLATAVLKVTCIVVGSRWGVTGVAAGYAVAHALEWPISLWWLSRITVIPARALTLGALRVLAVAGVAGGCAAVVVELLGTQPALLQLVAAALTVLAADALAALLVRPVRADVAGVVWIVRAALARRRTATQPVAAE